MRSHHQEYWDGFYAGPRTGLVPREPSLFATWCAERVPPDALLVEVGCGTARDAVWFAHRGYDVLAADYSVEAVDRAREQAGHEGVSLDLEVLDLYDAAQVSDLGRRLQQQPRQVHLYARFLLHALEPLGQAELLRLAAESLRGRPGTLMMEFRTGRDRAAPHEFGEHFRSYPDPDETVAAATASGARVLERVEGHGLAPYRAEDPHVCRLVLDWPAPAQGGAA